MTLEEYLAIPYIVTVRPVERPDGTWARHATYPELPECAVEEATVLEALDRLEVLRRQRIAEMLEQAEPIPVPRPKLRTNTFRSAKESEDEERGC